MGQIRTDLVMKEYNLQLDCDHQTCSRREMFSRIIDYKGIDPKGSQPTHPIYSHLIADANGEMWITDNIMTFCPKHITNESRKHDRKTIQIEFILHPSKKFCYYETDTHSLTVHLEGPRYGWTLYDLDLCKFVVKGKQDTIEVAKQKIIYAYNYRVVNGDWLELKEVIEVDFNKTEERLLKMSEPKFKIKVIVMETDPEQTTILEDCKGVAETISESNNADVVFAWQDNVYRYLCDSAKWVDLSLFQVELKKNG